MFRSILCHNQCLVRLRLVFTGDGVGVGVGVARTLPTK